MPGARWNLVVSAETDASLRQFLAVRGSHEDDLSRFVEEAVHAHILELSSREAKLLNADLDSESISAAVDEALDWARRR